MEIITKRFKSKKKNTSNNTMAKGKKSSKRKSSSRGSSSAFSGKVLGFKIPVVSGILRNKTFQKAAAGAGVVAIVLSLATLVNNPTVNRALGNQFVRLGLAGAGGDLVGVATQFFREGGISLGGNQQATTNGGVGAA